MGYILCIHINVCILCTVDCLDNPRLPTLLLTQERLPKLERHSRISHLHGSLALIWNYNNGDLLVHFYSFTTSILLLAISWIKTWNAGYPSQICNWKLNSKSLQSPKLRNMLLDMHGRLQRKGKCDRSQMSSQAYVPFCMHYWVDIKRK